MRFGVHAPNTVHADVLWQHAVQACQEALRQITLRIEMRYIIAGMHAGIRAAAPRDANGLPQDRAAGLLERFLNGKRVGLYLPAVEPGAVVSEGEEVTHGGRD